MCGLGWEVLWGSFSKSPFPRSQPLILRPSSLLRPPLGLEGGSSPSTGSGKTPRFRGKASPPSSVVNARRYLSILHRKFH